MMKTEYLYSIKPETLDNMYYYEALKFKYEKAKTLYEKLYSIKNRTWYQHVRIFFVEKAIRHTQKLIQERTEFE